MPAFGLIHLRSLLSASIALLLGLVAVTSQAQTITFEKLPDNSDPVDNLQLPLNTVFQVGRTGLSFGFDTNGDKIADQGVVMEQRGNADYSASEFCWGYTNDFGGNTANAVTDEDNTSSNPKEGGNWLVREKKKCNLDVDPAGNSIDQNTNYLLQSGNVDFVVTYSNVLPVNMAGQVWDLDNGEAFDVKAYSEANALVASQTIGPYCTNPNGTTGSGLACKGANREGLPATFTFADLDTPVKRLIISYNSADAGGGFAFDNFNATGAVVDVTEELDPNDDDGDGVDDEDDNCQLDANPDQIDTDADDVGNVCDVICPITPPGATGIDTDPLSDTYGCAVAEDPNDDDGDGVLDIIDQCSNSPSGAAVNSFGCVDTDNDGVADSEDCCPSVANPGQKDSDGDGIGDACEAQPIPVMGLKSVLLMSGLLFSLVFWWRHHDPEMRV